MATEIKNSAMKLKSNDPDLRKKMASSTKIPPDSKIKSVTKSEVKHKATSSSSKSTTKTTTTKVREKKVYNLLGQKHDPPEQKEPLRIFYESLSKQIPTSEMAEFWLMEHGMLSQESAKRAFEKKQRKQKELRIGTPVKPSKSATKTETSNKQESKNGDMKAKQVIVENDEVDDDFISSPKRRKGE